MSRLKVSEMNCGQKFETSLSFLPHSSYPALLSVNYSFIRCQQFSVHHCTNSSRNGFVAHLIINSLILVGTSRLNLSFRTVDGVIIWTSIPALESAYEWTQMYSASFYKHDRAKWSSQSFTATNTLTPTHTCPPSTVRASLKGCSATHILINLTLLSQLLTMMSVP